MIKIGGKVDIDGAMRWLTSLQREHIPAAQARALTETAQDAVTALQAQLPVDLDRPTPFTRGAFGVERATKSNLAAAVFIKDVQWQYLRFQVKGGTRYPKHKAVVEPIDVPLNQYGNMPRNYVRQLLSRKDVFVGKVNGAAGIYQRSGSKVKLLVAFSPQAEYKPRFDFKGIVHRVVKTRFRENFARAFRDAVRGAR